MVSFMSHFQNVSVFFTCKIKIGTLKITVRKDVRCKGFYTSNSKLPAPVVGILSLKTR